MNEKCVKNEKLISVKKLVCLSKMSNQPILII